MIVININNDRRVLGILMVVFSCISLICLILTVILFINSNNIMDNSEECIGTIVDFKVTHSGSDDSIHPIVSYEVNDQKYKFVSNYYSSSMKVGGSVEVLYNRNDYSDATIKSGVYFAPILMGIFAGVFFIPAIIMFIIRIISKKKTVDNKNGYYI